MQNENQDLSGNQRFRGLLNELGGEMAIAFFVHGQGAEKIDARNFVDLLRYVERSLTSANASSATQPTAQAASPAE